MSRSSTQSSFQQRSRQTPTASSADRPGRYPYESAWKNGSTPGSRYPRTTVWAILSATVGTPSALRAAVSLRYLHRAHRRGHVTPRREPVPELVQVPGKVPLKLRDRPLVNAGRALVGLDPQPGLPDGPLGDVKRLRHRLAHPAPPTRKRLTAKPARTTRPLRSSPSRPHRYYKTVRPCAPHRYSAPRSSRCLGIFPCATDRGPQQRHWPARPVGATGSPTFHARAKTTLAPPPRRTPPGQSTGTRQAHPGAPKHPPVSMPPKVFRRVISGSLALAFVIHTCRAHGATFPATLTTTALDRSSSGRFAASACTTTAEGHQTRKPGSPISCTAPHPAT